MRTSEQFQKAIDEIRARIATEEDPKVNELAERLITGLEKERRAVIASGIDIDDLDIQS